MDRWSLRSWRAHLALGLPAAIWFAPQLLFHRVGYFRDTGQYFQPHKAMIAAALHSGRLPQWDPFEYGGMPLFADPNFNTFHPLSLLTDLLPLPWGFGVFVFACALLGAYGARALGRTLGLGHGGALACGLFFAWCGPTVSFLLTGQAVASCTLPWLCAAGANLGARRSLGAFLLFALATASQFLSGTPEIGACAFALAGLLAISDSLARAELPDGNRAAARRALATGAMVLLATLLGAGLSAIQLLPSALFLHASSRAAGFSAANGLAFSLDPLRLPELLIPFFSGDIDGPGAISWLLPTQEPPYVQQIYLGAWVCALAILGLRGEGARRRWPLFVASALLTMLAFGNHFSAAALLWRNFPPLRIVRFPEKLIVPLSLAIAVCAGAGWERLTLWFGQIEPAPTKPGSRSGLARSLLWVALGLLGIALLARWPELWRSGSRWPGARLASLDSTALASIAFEAALGAGALLLIAMHLFGNIRRVVVLSGLAALLAIELANPGLRLDRTALERDWSDSPALAALLQTDAHRPFTAFRISSQSTGLNTPQLDAVADADGSPRSLALYRIRRAALMDAEVVRLGVRSDRGYSGFTPGGLSRLYARSTGGAALDLLGVRYGIEFGGGPSTYRALGFEPRPDLTAAVNAANPTLVNAGIRIYENLRAFPFAWLAPAVLTGSGEAAPRCGGREVPWLGESDLRALSPAVARAANCGAVEALNNSTEPHAETRDKASLISFEPERLMLQTDATAPSLLVLTESGLPGWRAFVDGVETPVLNADGALRACAVPAGSHQIVFTYTTPGLRAGALATLLSQGLLALLSGLALHRHRSNSPGRVAPVC